MLPVAKIIISGLTSIGAGMIASKLTKPLVSNANGIAKILLWFGSVGTGVAASAIVAREVEKPVSYTHLDVYKRQDQEEVTKRTMDRQHFEAYQITEEERCV